MSCLLFIFALVRCSTLFTHPDRLSQKQRFAHLQKESAPIKEKVSIFWDRHSIPFVEAKNDSDLAFAVGVTHAHLRIDQLELMRILSQGRLSEVTGPISQVKLIDHGVRMLGLKKSAEMSIANMSSESRQWMERFTEGINWYIGQLKSEPVTNRFFDLELEPYSLLDVMIISRLITLDLAWATYLKYIKAAEQEGWEEMFAADKKRLLHGTASFANEVQEVSKVFKMFSKSGSNSIVISGQKTKSGSSLIASDPHVGLLLPNFWFLIGIKSPNYHAVGYMIPGVPVIGVGRNRDIAWGGTNMRSISSHLYDVSDYPKDKIQVRKEKIKRRWWFPTEVTIRETEFGPILTDLPYFDPDKLPFVASVDWVGRKGSDEIQSFLKVAKAKNWSDFKSAFKTYKVSAFNMLYGDKAGNIGMVSAYAQPKLKDPSKTLDLVKSTDNPVVSVVNPVDHPNPYNPASGFIATANNKPYSNPKIPFAFEFSKNHRVDRLIQYGKSKKALTLGDMKKLQQDVFSQKAFDLKLMILESTKADKDLASSSYFQKVAAWDGRYSHDSINAVYFYSLMLEIWGQYVEEFKGPELLKKNLAQSAYWKEDLAPWLEKKTPKQVIDIVKNSIPKAGALVEEYASWGEMLIQIQTPPLGAIPYLGRRFRLDSYPASGSAHTVYKSDRQFNGEQQDVFYGASARHISDLSSVDENHFVTHGGQDSWHLNENINDQTALWRKGEYIRIPLTMEKVRAKFSQHTTTLLPTP